MDWLIAAPFSKLESDQWLGAFTPEQYGRQFASVVAGYDHDRSRKSSSISQWRDYFKHGTRAWFAARRAPRPTGLISCFPQIPLAIGLCNMVLPGHIPTIAWTFNLGTLAQGMKKRLSATAFAHVDLFVVHSRHEIGTCSEWLQLPQERFRFVPLQRALRSSARYEDEDRPFVLSMGSAHRDYKLLLGVMGELGYRTVIVCAPHAIDGLSLSPNVEIRSGLTLEQCHELLRSARVHVVPVDNLETASGQVTLLDGMMFGCPTVATACPGTVDYVDDGSEALLVQPNDHEQLKAAIDRLWSDASLRLRLAESARQRVEADNSDQSVGRAMGHLLNEIEQRFL